MNFNLKLSAIALFSSLAISACGSSQSASGPLDGTYQIQDGDELVSYMKLTFSGDKMTQSVDCEKLAVLQMGDDSLVPAAAKGKIISAETKIEVNGNKVKFQGSNNTESLKFKIEYNSGSYEMACSAEISAAEAEFEFSADKSILSLKLLSEGDSEEVTLKRTN